MTERFIYIKACDGNYHIFDKASVAMFKLVKVVATESEAIEECNKLTIESKEEKIK